MAVLLVVHTPSVEDLGKVCHRGSVVLQKGMLIEELYLKSTCPSV